MKAVVPSVDGSEVIVEADSEAQLVELALGGRASHLERGQVLELVEILLAAARRLE